MKEIFYGELCKSDNIFGRLPLYFLTKIRENLGAAMLFLCCVSVGGWCMIYAGISE